MSSENIKHRASVIAGCLLLPSLLFLAGCAAGGEKATPTSSAKQTASLDSAADITGSLKLVFDEDRMPEGWKQSELEPAPGGIEPEEGTAVDLEAENGACFFYMRVEPEIIQTSQVGLGDRFLTTAFYVPFLETEADSSTAQMEEAVLFSTTDGGSVETMLASRFDAPYLSQISAENGEIQEVEVAGQNQLLGKRIFDVNAEEYTIPADAITEEMGSLPAPKLSSVPALTAVLSCQSAEDVKVDTYRKLVETVSLANISKVS